MTPFRKTFSCVALFLCGIASVPAQQAISQERVEEVIARFESDSGLIDSLACVFNLNAIPVLSVVGPEWVRYSIVRDLMETKALELAYVRFGREAADFSIGPHQMKPSFAEDLELAIAQTGSLPVWLRRQIAYASDVPAVRRRIRVQRLKDKRWQYFYAFAFFALSQNRFAGLLPEAESQRLAFIASAYNFGFTHSPAAIRKWQSAEVFPYGSAFRRPQESYSGVALRFYLEMQRQRGKVW